MKDREDYCTGRWKWPPVQIGTEKEREEEGRKKENEVRKSKVLDSE